jgi:hypothetical protein
MVWHIDATADQPPNIEAYAFIQKPVTPPIHNTKEFDP